MLAVLVSASPIFGEIGVTKSAASCRVGGTSTGSISKPEQKACGTSNSSPPSIHHVPTSIMYRMNRVTPKVYSQPWLCILGILAIKDTFHGLAASLHAPYRSSTGFLISVIPDIVFHNKAALLWTICIILMSRNMSSSTKKNNKLLLTI